MKLRAYMPSDCPAMAELFYNTVHSINAADYTEKQLNAWATGTVDLEKWNHSFLEHLTMVAFINDVLVGFADMDQTGYLDRLYVHKDYQGQGIASALCAALESGVSAKKYTTHASVTARPFFERKGYSVVKKQQVERCGILMTNYCMEKQDFHVAFS